MVEPVGLEPTVGFLRRLMRPLPATNTALVPIAERILVSTLSAIALKERYSYHKVNMAYVDNGPVTSVNRGYTEIASGPVKHTQRLKAPTYSS